jgi:DNA polymerase III sliding clamp (beta) subunit (PCNA family)
MKITIEAERLRDAISNSVATHRPTAPAHGALYFDPAGSGLLVIKSYEQHKGLWLEHEIDCEIEGQQVPFVIEPRQLSASLTGITGRVVLTSDDDNKSLNISRPKTAKQKFSYSAPLIEPSSWPQAVELPHQNEIDLLASELATAIDEVSYCIDPKDRGKPFLQGLHLTKGLALGMSAHRSAKVPMPSCDLELFIPQQTLADLRNHLESEAFLVLAGIYPNDPPTHLIVKCENKTLTLKLDGHKCPNYKRGFFDLDTAEHVLTFNRSELVSAYKRLINFVGEQKNLVCSEFVNDENGLLSVTGRLRNESAEDAAREGTSTEAEAPNILINLKLMIDALTKAKAEAVLVHIWGPNKPLIITTEDRTVEHLTMPVVQ